MHPTADTYSYDLSRDNLSKTNTLRKQTFSRYQFGDLEAFVLPTKKGTMKEMSIKAHPPHYALHVPVLLDATVQTLQPKPGESYLDLTAGYGGHARAILSRTKIPSAAVLVDRDINAIGQLSELKEQGAELIHADFVTAARQLIESQKTFDLVLVDLGVSSPQLDRAERGFSFAFNGVLDMRMDPSQETSAADIVNRYSEQALVKLFTTYGEEPLGFARRVAKAIVRTRPIRTTKELADLILNEHRGGWKRIHPATRTFQALRIETNDELGQIEAMLPLLPKLLNSGGRVGVISFHSLEDRLVKRYFKEQANAGYESTFDLVTKRPIDGATSDVHNPRSRSSKLRVAVKK